MRRRSSLSLGVAVSLLAGSAPADAPSASAVPAAAPAASVASSAGAVASASAAGSAAATPPAPLAPLGAMATFPDTTSPKPAPAEWDSAEPLLLERPNAGCSMSHIREWVRVSCRFGEALLTGVRVIAGPTEGVELTDRPLAPGQVPVNQWGGRVAHGVNLTFAVHRGDRRMFEVIETMFEGRYVIGEDAAAIVSVLWLPGEAGPTIVVD